MAALMSRPVGFASHSRRQPQHHGVVRPAVSARRAGAIVHRCGGGGGGRHALLSVIKLGNTAAEEHLSRGRVADPHLASPAAAATAGCLVLRRLADDLFSQCASFVSCLPLAGRNCDFMRRRCAAECPVRCTYRT